MGLKIRAWQLIGVSIGVALTFVGIAALAQAPPAKQVETPSTASSSAPPVPPTPTAAKPVLDEPVTPAEVKPELSIAPYEEPTGFTGPSGVLPTEVQAEPDAVPVEDRWRIGFPFWDRYGKGHPPVDDYPYVEGHWWDPYNQNVLKGDYPIIGQHTFLEITATSFSIMEGRQVPTATTPFESTTNPFQQDFFGKPSAFLYTHYFRFAADLFHGDAGFKPVDWRIRLAPVFNVNYLAAEELAVVNPDVRKGTTLGRTFMSLNEYFLEAKLADLSPDYDFLSVRAGSQPFTSDFRGFIFSDVNRSIRLFGTRLSNQEQFNIIWFDMQEKDTNSGLNTFQDRNQYVLIANYFRQDFLYPGYTTELSVHYNRDEPSFHYNKNDFLVRPAPVGVFQPHGLDVAYLGWAGDGHIGRYNITHAFYWALGRDSLNPFSNQAQNINAQMGAIELSYDRDWTRFRTSFLWASGDSNINNSHATGFDSILDNVNFAGGQFSYWVRQAIPLFGVNLVNRLSLLPDLRPEKIESQSNFVNPGLLLFNLGIDFDLTPKWKMINNCNFLWFDQTASLEQFTYDGHLHNFIGTDLSTGFEYRPLLNNNIVMTFGLAGLLPGRGFKDLYNHLGTTVHPLGATFMELNLTY
jgi:hypothetical protein